MTKHVYNVWIQTTEGSVDFTAHLSIAEADGVLIRLQAARRLGDLTNFTITLAPMLTAETVMPAIGRWVQRMIDFHNSVTAGKSRLKPRLKRKKVCGNYA